MPVESFVSETIGFVVTSLTAGQGIYEMSCKVAMHSRTLKPVPDLPLRVCANSRRTVSQAGWQPIRLTSEAGARAIGSRSSSKRQQQKSADSTDIPTHGRGEKE